ncbi:MAG TPA: RsmE family RNA methyltransferase [Gemmatimonadales bacterium]|nr:RsmE family RNA methyltransferase [Gemmatimonadales bacterium]
MITVLAEPGSIVTGGVLKVSVPEEHHLGVLRVEERSELRVVDGQGTIGWGRFTWSPPTIAIERVEQAPAPVPLWLAAGAGDKDRFFTLVEKAVELGVTRIVPLETEHSRSVSSRVRPVHVEKLVQRAGQALKQSRNPWLPVIDQPATLDSFVRMDLPAVRWLADGAGPRPTRVEATTAMVVVVGPEGGLTDSEREALVRAGFAPVTLGPYVLRFDTAAVAALTLAAHLRSREPA